MTFEEVNALANLKDLKLIKAKLKEQGYFDASKDKRTQRAGLDVIAKAPRTESEDIFTDDDNYGFKVTEYKNAKGFEQFSFVWVDRLLLAKKDDVFEEISEAYYIPDECLIYAKIV